MRNRQLEAIPHWTETKISVKLGLKPKHFMAEENNLGETSSGLPANVGATIACVFPLLGGSTMLVIETKNRFVRFYALQSIFFGLVLAVASIALRIITGILYHIPLLGGLLNMVIGLAWALVSLGVFAIWAFQAYKAFSGVEWEMPVLGPLVRQQMAKQ